MQRLTTRHPHTLKHLQEEIQPDTDTPRLTGKIHLDTHDRQHLARKYTWARVGEDTVQVQSSHSGKTGDCRRHPDTHPQILARRETRANAQNHTGVTTHVAACARGDTLGPPQAQDGPPPTNLVLAGPESGVLQDVESPFLSPTARRVRVDLSRGQTCR